MNPVDIEKSCSEHTKFHLEIENTLRQTYYKGIDEQVFKTEELKNDIKDHVFRRYERTLTYYIPWITKVLNLSDKEIIEIGCGTGSSTAAFSHFTKHIYAYEVSESSVLAAKSRMQIMGINNVSIIQSAPDDLLEILKSNHSSGVSVILLFAVLEHMTVQERLKTLKEAWDLLLPGGTLIVADTPNRLTYFDYHTSQLPFFHFLPLDLAVKYYEKSSRNQFKLAIKKQLDSGTVADAKNALIRWGNAVSYHEFEIVLGSNLKDLLVADGDSEEMRNLYPLSTEEKLLQQYFIEAKINQPLAFTNQILNLIFQKKSLNLTIELTQMTPNQRIHQELDDNGYIIINLLNENEVQSLLSFDKNSSLPNDLVNSPMCFSINTSEVSYRQLVTQEIKRFFAPNLAKIFPKYRIALCNLVRKKPDKLYSEMPLHQDPSLIDEESLTSYGVWCPLVDVDEQNGCLQLVKKSHSLNSKIRPFFVFNGFPYSQEIQLLMQQRYLTSIPMKAGQALIYDKRLFHSSPPNLTTVERVAAICSLVPQNILTHFCYRESPTSDQIELFEVEDEFYDRYIVGEKPEGVKSLGIFDCEVEPLTPEKLMETVEKESQFSSTNNQILSPQSQGWMLTAQQLQDELTQTKAELKESNEQLHQTQDELKESNEQLHQTQDELEELKIQQSQTQAELEQSQTQLQTQLTESAELRKSNEQLHQTQDELEELKIQQSQTQAELEQDKEQLHQTQLQLEELKIQQFQTQAELEHSCTQLQAQLTESNKQLHQKTRELQALQEEYSHTKLELEEYREKLHLSQAKLEQDRQQLHQAQNKLEELKIQQFQTQSELEQSQTQLHQTQALSEHYQIQLHQIQEQLEQSQIQLQQKTVQLDKLKSQQHHTRLAQIIKERSQI